MRTRQLDSGEAREAFLREHLEEVYAGITEGYREFVRVEELVFRTAERYPGLVPSRARIAEERGRRQSDKLGLELDQGRFLARVLAHPRAGRHLVHAMLRPRAEALARQREFEAAGRLDLGLARLERRGHAGQVELANLRYLNAEDDAATAALEIAVDLVLLHPELTVGVLRGAVVDHPKYMGRRVFNSGINLTHLYHGRISFVDFMMARELGLVAKLYRGHFQGTDFEDPLEDLAEKPWIGVVEAHAIGGGCQLLLALDRVIAERGSLLSLPARKEGIIPGTSNRRLTRFVGDRLARQMVMFERALSVASPEGRLLCDEVVEPAGMEAAIDSAAAQLVSSGVVSAAANRRAIRLGEETLDEFRLYQAVYARDQARCLYSPAMIANLERNWRAGERRLEQSL